MKFQKMFDLFLELANDKGYPTNHTKDSNNLVWFSSDDTQKAWYKYQEFTIKERQRRITTKGCK